jgi:hypothetical protein
MESTDTELAILVKPMRKPNRGSFSPGDPRINRKGRPKGAAVAARKARNGKPLSGRLQTLRVPLSDLEQFLTGRRHPWLVNLPRDFEIVDVAVDVERAIAEVILHSESFMWVPLGERLPEFRAKYNGLMWRRSN